MTLPTARVTLAQPRGTRDRLRDDIRAGELDDDEGEEVPDAAPDQ
ncbi:hypothetical protein [Streptomyces sp. URMC 129]